MTGKKIFRMNWLFAIAVIFLSRFCDSKWNFASVGLPENISIWRFTIWRHRAFLAIPSFSKRDQNVSSEFTIVEAPWPERAGNDSGVPLNNVVEGSSKNLLRPFPKISSDSSEIGDCERPSSVVGLDVESRGRLWILDVPDVVHCPPKVLVYDLRRSDIEIARTDLTGIPKDNLRTLVLDPFPIISGPRAYIGDPGDESIIVYSLYKKKWWKLGLATNDPILKIRPMEMAVSRRNSLLYLTDPQSNELFGIDLETWRNEEGPATIPFQNDMVSRNATVQRLGMKMGSSSGLATDHKGGLHYFLVTEHASVRWDTKYDLKTTSHSILLQSVQVPCITDYRIDGQRNVWGLVSLEHPFAKTTSFQDKWDAKFRTIRVFKYSPFGP